MVASIKISSVKASRKCCRPTITDRDFVVATIAAPTIVKEPEKPAEEFLQREEKVKLLQQQKVVEAAAPAKEGDAQLKKMIKVKTLLVIKSSCHREKKQEKK